MTRLIAFVICLLLTATSGAAETVGKTSLEDFVSLVAGKLDLTKAEEVHLLLNPYFAGYSSGQLEYVPEPRRGVEELTPIDMLRTAVADKLADAGFTVSENHESLSRILSYLAFHGLPKINPDTDPIYLPVNMN